MNNPALRSCLHALSRLGLLLLLSGCSTPQWRGTPYYHSEFGTDVHAIKERIPFRPVVYYRSPTLEVLGGLFEKSDEFMALRPLFSAYGLNKPPDRRVYSFLWPLGQFNRADQENRFVPFFWGRDYVVGFPLYWHFKNANGCEGTTDALIPLWWCSQNKGGYSYNVIGPLINFMNCEDSKGWRVWPLAGAYSSQGGEGYYRFIAWPLAHQWSSGHGAPKATAVLPLFLNWSTADASSFYSLLYSRHRDAVSRWDLLLPLLYHSLGPEGSKTFTPLYFQGESADQKSAWQLLLPFYYFKRDPGGRLLLTLPYSCHRDDASRWDLVFPLLYHSRNPEGSRTLSPLYFQGESADQKTAWQLLLPLYYSNRDATSRTLLSLLGGMIRDEEGMGWVALPILAGGVSNKDGTGCFLSLPWSRGSFKDGSRWSLIPPLMFKTESGKDKSLFTPLYSSGTTDGGTRSWQTVVPLWYRNEGGGEKMVATLAGGWQTDAAGRTWLIWPLLSGGHKSANGRDLWVVAPMFHAHWDQDGVSHHLLPLYWWNAGDRRLISPFVSSWNNHEKGTRNILVPPVLSLYSSEPKRTDLWAIAGQTHLSWGEEAGSSHILPLYYSNPASGTFLSIPWSRWSDGLTSTNTLIAPALSWLRRGHERNDLWVLGPLAHKSWGKEAGTSHILPLYYSNPASGTFLSIPWSRWSDGLTSTNTLIVPALSWLKRGQERNDLWVLGPLAHKSWGKEPGTSHILPLYYSDPGSGTFLSIPWSRWSDGLTSTNTLVAPALSWLRRGQDRNDLWVLGPLSHFSWGEKANTSHVIPLFYRDKQSDTFISLPYAHWKELQAEYDLYPPLLSCFRKGDHANLFISPLFGWDDDPVSGYYYPLTPLVGVRTGKHSGGWVFPFWSRDYDKELNETTGNFLWGSYSRTERETQSSLIPFYSYTNRKVEPVTNLTHSSGATMGKTFWSLPAIWYRNTVEVNPVLNAEGRPSGRVETRVVRDNGCFPFWTYTYMKTPAGDDTSGSLLLLLYNYKATIKAGEGAGSPPEETLRKRVLWWLWTYQRTSNMVSVDIFPAITYDAGIDGYRKWAFLGRVFRYEKGPEGRKLDLLFIPVLRKSSREEGFVSQSVGSP